MANKRNLIQILLEENINSQWFYILVCNFFTAKHYRSTGLKILCSTLPSRHCNIGISISISTNQIRELGSSQFLWDTAKIITYFLFCSHHSGSSSSTTHSARGGFQWWPHSYGHRPAASPISDLWDGGRGVQEKIQEANWQYRLLLHFQGKNKNDQLLAVLRQTKRKSV